MIIANSGHVISIATHLSEKLFKLGDNNNVVLFNPQAPISFRF